MVEALRVGSEIEVGNCGEDSSSCAQVGNKSAEELGTDLRENGLEVGVLSVASEQPAGEALLLPLSCRFDEEFV